MKKSYAIFILEKKRGESFGDSSYYTLGTLHGIIDDCSDEEGIAKNMDIKEGELITILPVYRK